MRLRLIAVLAVAVAGIAALAGGFFLLTEPGLRILVVQASSLAPGTLTVDQARGRVAGPMHLTGVRYVDGDLVVEAADLRADLVLSSFLAGRVDLAEVAVSGLAVRLPPPSEDQAPAREGPPEIRAPLTLRLHGGVVEDVTIIPHQGDPVVIERIAASGAIGRKGLSVDSLVVTREALVLDVSGRIRNDSPQPVDIRYAWSLEPEDRASFQGDGEITGSWTALTVRHRLASPFTSHLLLDVRDLLQNPSARLELTFAGLSPADLVTGLPQGDLSGEAAGAGGPDSFSLDASLHGEVAGTMDLAGALNLTREGPVLKLESGKLQSVKAGMDLSVTGQFDTADLAAPLTLAAGWRNLAWPPGAAEPLVKSREGELEAKGRREAFTARLAAHLEGKGIGPGTGTMSGAGDEKGFALESFRLPILGGEVLGTGSVQWAEGLAWRLTARGSDLDPGLVREDWPGRVTLALEGSGRHREGDRNLLLKVSGIGGTLRGNELGGSAELAAEGPIIRIRELNLSMGSSRLTAEGLAGDEWDISASFKSGDIGVLAPEAGGSAAGSLALTGPRASPRVQARLEGDRLAVGAFRAGHLSAKADAAMDPDAPFTADIEVIGAAMGEGAAGTLALTGSGSWKKHRVVIEAASGEKKAAAVIQGGADSGMWSGDMIASLLGGSVTGRWSVGLGEPSRWDAALTVAGIDPGELRPGLAGEISLEAAGKGEGGPGARQWSVRVSGLEGRIRDLPVRGAASLEAAGNSAALTSMSVRLGRSSLEASGGILPDLSLNARLYVPSFEELVSRTAGQAELTVSITGPASAPVLRLSGSASDLSHPAAAFGDVTLGAVFGTGPDDPAAIRFSAEKLLLGGRNVNAVSLSVEGSLSSHRGVLRVRAPVTDADVTILGKMTGSSWAGTADGSTLGGAFRLVSRADWKGPLRLETRMEISGLEPQRISPSLPEKVSLSGQASGERSETGFTGQVRVKSLSGSYRGLPLTGRADVEAAAGGLTVRTLELGVGSGKVNLSGQALSPWDLRWDVDWPDLSSLGAGLSGAVAASGQVTGPPEAPRIQGSARAGELSYGTVRIKEAGLVADVDPAAFVMVKADLTGITGGDYGVDRASLAAAGPLSAHTVSLDLVSPHGNLNMGITGGVREGSWTGQIDLWEIASKSFGQWSLTRPAPLSLGEVISAGPVCLGSRGGEACVDARWQAQDKLGEGSLRWSGLGLDLAEGAAPAGFDFKGTTEGSVQLSFSQGAAALTGRLRTSAGSVSYARTGEKEEAGLALVFTRLGAEVTLDEAGLRGLVDGDLGKEGGQEGQFLLMTFEVPGLKVPAAPEADEVRVRGSLKARFADLDLVEAFLPELSQVRGVYTADLAVEGPVRQPRLSGRMSLAGATFKLLTPGITLEQVDVKTTIVPDNEVRIEGSAVSGKGKLKVDGSMILNPAKGWPVNLNLSGDRFEIARTPAVWILVSPDLDIGFEKGQVRVSGSVRIPEAALEPADIRTTSAPSSDIRVKGRQEPPPEEDPVRIQAEVTLGIGEKITFKGFGLTGRVSGSLSVTERPGEPTAAAGELQVHDGEYRAFGRTLAIERGRLIFTGGQIDNPGLDVRAVRQVRDVTAGVQVTGTLLSPVLSLFSEPPLEESEILSYLVLGRPLAQASTEDAQVLSEAATAVSLAGGLAIAKQIGQTFGLEEVRIETGEEAEESTLVVGKYLSPRVYVQYGVGLFESINIFRFGYQLSRRFLLQGESGVDSGADLIYTIERK